MARYSNIMNGGIASCYLNGRQIAVIDGEVFVDGVHYVPSDGEINADGGMLVPGKMVKHIFEVSRDYDSILTSGFLDVVFTQVDNDEDCGVTGHIPENLIDKMDIRVEDSTLTIALKPGNYNLELPDAATIYVRGRNIRNVTSSGSGDFIIDGDLDTGGKDFSALSSGSSDFKSGRIKAHKASVSITSSGSGNIDIEGAECNVFMAAISGSADVDCGSVYASVSSVSIKGSGNVTINGTTDSVILSIAGSGDIQAGGFKAKSGKASVAGSGDITCNVERLSDRVRGSGDIHNRY